MARQVGKDYTVNLSASQRAGTRALGELYSQGHISTTSWFNLNAEAIVDESPYTSTTRILHFHLEGGQRVEVKVMAWQRGSHNETEESAEGRKWFPCHVYVEKGERMEAYENHVTSPKGYPWSRQPEFDKPLPGVTWRAPTTEEIAAYTTAVVNRDEGAFLTTYYAGLIAWPDINNGSVKDENGWIKATLRKRLRK